MEELKKELDGLWKLISDLKTSMKYLKRYKSNKFYKIKYESTFKELNRFYKFFRARLENLEKESLDGKIKTLDKYISTLLSEENYDEKLSIIEKLELFWPDLEIEFEDLKIKTKNFEVPSEIPINESRLDLEEAIRNYDNGCYLSALVMCRRAYEGALAEIYKSETGGEPLEEVRCKHCNNVIRGKSYMGISKLHNWAMKNGLITEKLRQIGFLVPDLGAGAAHPPLKYFPRDKELAKLGIIATITLLKEVYTQEQSGNR